MLCLAVITINYNPRNISYPLWTRTSQLQDKKQWDRVNITSLYPVQLAATHWSVITMVVVRAMHWRLQHWTMAGHPLPSLPHQWDTGSPSRILNRCVKWNIVSVVMIIMLMIWETYLQSRFCTHPNAYLYTYIGKGGAKVPHPLTFLEFTYVQYTDPSK